MKRNLKKGAAVMLCAILLAACGSNQDGQDEESIAFETEQTQVSTGETPVESQAASEVPANRAELTTDSLVQAEQSYFFGEEKKFQDTSISVPMNAEEPAVELLDYDAAKQELIAITYPKNEESNRMNIVKIRTGDGTTENLYQSDAFMSSDYAYHNGILSLIETEEADEGFQSVLVIRRADGQVLRSDFGIVKQIPTVTWVGDMIYVNYASGDKEVISKVASVSPVNGERNVIDEANYTQSENEAVQGTELLGLGDSASAFVYQSLDMKGPSRDSNNTASLKIKDAANATKTVNVPFESRYVNYLDQVVILSEYISGDDLRNTGYFYYPEASQYSKFMIPGIEPGYDIRGSFRIGDGIFAVYNQRDLYYIDVNNKRFVQQRYANAEDAFYTSVFHKGSNLHYLEIINDQLKLHTVNLG